MSGLHLPDGGTVRLNGRDIGGLPAHAITRRGLARSFQITNLFEGLSIYENLRLYLQERHRGHFDPWHDVDSSGAVPRQKAAMRTFPGLEGIWDKIGRETMRERGVTDVVDKGVVD